MQTKNLLGQIRNKHSIRGRFPDEVYFSCVLLVVIDVLKLFFNTLSLIFFSINTENVRECCKVQ